MQFPGVPSLEQSEVEAGGGGGGGAGVAGATPSVQHKIGSLLIARLPQDF